MRKRRRERADVGEDPFENTKKHNICLLVLLFRAMSPDDPPTVRAGRYQISMSMSKPNPHLGLPANHDVLSFLSSFSCHSCIDPLKVLPNQWDLTQQAFHLSELNNENYHKTRNSSLIILSQRRRHILSAGLNVLRASTIIGVHSKSEHRRVLNTTKATL